MSIPINTWIRDAIVEITLQYFLASLGLFAPISLPTRALVASCIPIGNMKSYASILKAMIKAACSMTPRIPAKTTVISNAHISAQNITVAGIDNLKYSYHPVKDSSVGKNTHS